MLRLSAEHPKIKPCTSARMEEEIGKQRARESLPRAMELHLIQRREAPIIASHRAAEGHMWKSESRDHAQTPLLPMARHQRQGASLVRKPTASSEHSVLAACQLKQRERASRCVPEGGVVLLLPAPAASWDALLSVMGPASKRVATLEWQESSGDPDSCFVSARGERRKVACAYLSQRKWCDKGSQGGSCGEKGGAKLLPEATITSSNNRTHVVWRLASLSTLCSPLSS